MKVLLAVENLFVSIGGGQRFFSNLIKAHPDIEFYYFRSDVTSTLQMPLNAHAIPLSDVYRRNVHLLNVDAVRVGEDLPFEGKTHDLAYLMDMAASVSSMRFDVLDIPDYLPLAVFLKEAMDYHRVEIGKVCLSMHGTLSMGLKDNWDPNISGLDLLERYENELYNYADTRYGISKRYTSAWAARNGGQVHVIDPDFDVSMLEDPLSERLRPRPASADSYMRPDLCFVGRQEKWKGPDIFVEFCSRLPREAFNAFRLIGPKVQIHGYSSELELGKLAKNRKLDLASEVIPAEGIQKWFESERVIVIAPSRKDTFNLVALESLLAGCPTVISVQCGVCDYLDEVYPGIPYLKFDPDNIMAAADAVIDLAQNYDKYRQRLSRYLAAHKRKEYGEAINLIYSEANAPQAATRDAIKLLFSYYLKVVRRGIHQAVDWHAGNAGSRIGEFFNGRLDNPLTPAWAQSEFRRACAIAEVEQSVAIAQSSVEAQLAVESAIEIFKSGVFGGCRVNIYKLMATWERSRGNDLLYATYMLRVMRLTQGMSSDVAAGISAILNRSGYEEESKVIDLLCKSDQEDIYKYLMERIQKNYGAPPTKFIKKADFRDRSIPKVSVIVSVYKGADKADCFIQNLELFTAEAKAITEIIFVDSNSPDDTATTLPERLALARKLGIQSLYVRTRERETIQRAWNRGIELARGKYLAFLGLDEAVRPDALAVLARYLDRNPAVDWVQGSAVVTEVNAQGSYVKDVMSYDRSFDLQEMHYLDCCYISYVGALYRASIHQRFGYYDDSFRGAGDTEFKNRILPFVKVVSLPETLGTFLNYPEDRTTQSPMAELEDLRAWYIYRTPAGMRYALEAKERDAVVRLFKKSLHYRKSYMDKLCTDVELASSIVQYLRARQPHVFADIEHFVQGLAALQVAYRRFDELSPSYSGEGLEKPYQIKGSLERVWFNLEQAQKAHSFFALPGNYWLTNDNRWHQHHLLWPSRSTQVAVESPLTLADLADCSDLRDLFRDSASTDGGIDSWESNPASDRLDLLLPLSGRNAAEIRSFANHLKDANLVSVVASGGAGSPWGASTYPLISSARRFGRTAYAAAKVVVFPWERGDLSDTELCEVVRAICYVKPVVVSRKIKSALAEQFHGVDFSELPTTDISSEGINCLRALCANAKQRSSLHLIIAKIANELGRSGYVTPNQDFTRGATLVEWEISKANFDEHFYSKAYIDVANAVKAGLFESGWHHYDQAGRKEGRRAKARPPASAVVPAETEFDGTSNLHHKSILGRRAK